EGGTRAGSGGAMTLDDTPSRTRSGGGAGSRPGGSSWRRPPGCWPGCNDGSTPPPIPRPSATTSVAGPDRQRHPEGGQSGPPLPFPHPPRPVVLMLDFLEMAFLVTAVPGLAFAVLVLATAISYDRRQRRAGP